MHSKGNTSKDDMTATGYPVDDRGNPSRGAAKGEEDDGRDRMTRVKLYQTDAGFRAKHPGRQQFPGKIFTAKQTETSDS